MNSRIALLSLFFSAPVFCMDNPTAPVANSGICSQVCGFAKSCVTTPVNFVFAGADKVADVTYLNTLISKVTGSYLSESTNAWIGRLTVLAATAALTNEVYKRYIASQNTDENDADFDFTYEANETETENN